MAETWVIKDNAPVDAASRTLATTNIPFTTNNRKATSIGINSEVAVVLAYGGIGEVAGFDPGSSGYVFEWDNEAYKTLVFDIAPTGELLAWLQKNATKQVVEYLITDTDLIKVANAIRAKSGTTAKLSFPDGFVQAIGGEEYDGDYKVTPKFTEEVLKTKNKIMKDNVLVYPIEVARVSNPIGGTTVYIGGITNG